MLRISKLSDYGTVIMRYLAEMTELRNAREIARETKIAIPTVSKLLKLLANAGLLESTLGVRGGYNLPRHPKEISVLNILEAIEGKVALTECTERSGECLLEPYCTMRSNWQIINGAIYETLKELTLEDLVSNQLKHTRIGKANSQFHKISILNR